MYSAIVQLLAFFPIKEMLDFTFFYIMKNTQYFIKMFLDNLGDFAKAVLRIRRRFFNVRMYESLA